jgi:2-amino-4-hydroxy-6-hydroxymethyldihydropteridine diphosphokinase
MELLEMMQAIEAAMGRRSGVQYGQRAIDLDLLFYDGVQIETRKLTIPHPRMAQRAFVLKPLAEIAPDLMHPVLYYTISQLLQDAEDVEQVQIYQPEQQLARASSGPCSQCIYPSAWPSAYHNPISRPLG